jgi:FlaA1/EpsC-like NDP-sugar epimerase
VREGVSAFKANGSWAWSNQFAPYGALLVLVIAIRLLTLRYVDLYRIRGEFSFVDDGLRVFKATAIGSLLIVAAAFLYRGGFAFRSFSYARSVFVADFVFALVSIGLIRYLTRVGQTIVRRRQINLIPTLVVGRGPEASLFINQMRDRPALGYRVIGVVDIKPIDGRESETYEGVPVVSNLEGLPEAIRDSGANEVIIADPEVNGDALFEVMIRCGRRRGVEFRIAPSLFNCLPRKTEIDQIGVLPMIRLFREPLSSGARLLKRTFDIVCSVLATALLFPLWLLIALLIELDSKGPIFYTQERVGMDGRLFLVFKFRTM